MEFLENIEWVDSTKFKVKKGQAIFEKRNNKKIIKKHKMIATISIFCGILIVLDYMLVYKFITLLQTLD